MKKIVIIALICIIVLIIVLSIIVFFLFLSGSNDMYKSEVENYLNKKYSEEFDVSFIRSRKGLDKESFGCDGSFCYYPVGLDDNTVEYVYSFASTSHPDVTGYVVYSYNKADNTSNISERKEAGYDYCGSPYSNEDYYGESIEAEKAVEKLRETLDDSYLITYKYGDDWIKIASRTKSLEYEVINNYEELEELYRTIIECLDGQAAIIDYGGNNIIYIYANSSVDDYKDDLAQSSVIRTIKTLDELEKILPDDYLIEKEFDIINISTDLKLVDEAQNNYNELSILIRDINNIVNEYYGTVYLKFGDTSPCYIDGGDWVTVEYLLENKG